MNGTKLEYPNMSTGNYSHLIFDKDAKTFAWQKKTSSKKIVLGKLYDHVLKNIRSESPILHRY